MPAPPCRSASVARPPPAPCRRATPARPQGRTLLHELPGAGAESSSRALERQRAALTVPQHLNLDMAGADDGALDIEGPVREGRLGLRRHGQERRLQVFRVGNQPHAPSPPPADALRRRGSRPRRGAHLLEAGGPVRARDERRPGVRGRLLCANLVALDLDRLRPGAPKTRSLSSHAAAKSARSARAPSRGARLRTQLSRPRPRAREC